MRWETFSIKPTGNKNVDGSYIAVKYDMSHEKGRTQTKILLFSGWEDKGEWRKQGVPWKYGYWNHIVILNVDSFLWGSWSYKH